MSRRFIRCNIEVYRVFDHGSVTLVALQWSERRDPAREERGVRFHAPCHALRHFARIGEQPSHGSVEAAVSAKWAERVGEVIDRLNKLYDLTVMFCFYSFKVPQTG